jgi:hypothetical protein
MKSAPNEITSHKAGSPSQFRFAGTGFWSGVSEFYPFARNNHYEEKSEMSEVRVH